MYGDREWYRQVTARPSSSGARADERAADRVIHVVIDGVSQSFLSEVMPRNVKELMEEGSWIKNCHTIWPSITGPAHTALNSGAYPGTNGVALPYLPESVKDDRIELLNPLAVSQAESVVEALARQGLRSAGICGHMNRSLQYFISEAYLGHDAERVTDEAIKALGDLEPNYLQVVYFAVDTVQHRYGVWTDEAREALEWVDAELGRLVEWTKNKGGRTVFVISADHGQVPTSLDVTRIIAPKLEELGFRWHGYGRFSILWAENPKRQLQELENVIRSSDLGALVHHLWSKDELAYLGAEGEAYGSGALLLRSGYMINSVPSGQYLANHGGYERDEIVVPLIFSGSGVRTKHHLDFAETVDVAPTICALLGCEGPRQADGQVLDVLESGEVGRRDSERSKTLQKLLA